MTRIAKHQRADVRFEDVPRLAERYIESLPYNQLQGSHVVLRGTIVGIALGCEVLLKLTSPRTLPESSILDVHWQPLGEDPYPTFDGTLSAVRLEPECCRLELAGEYVPPGGIVGAAFDAVIGHRIAEQSIENLLATFKSEFERRFGGKAAVKAS